jgi:hypothetical protein
MSRFIEHLVIYMLLTVYISFDCVFYSQFTALKCLSRSSELRILKLGLCSGVSDIGLAFIGTNCTKLLELDLYRLVKFHPVAI